ncbi:MAG: hypothetical protein KKA07_07330 [Bacteroidetes bacterium]|nr:hypothetical protein [Bacteroidota bacterium]MBU1718872.1 hypothetical protein [Bacteroidota bacterium]
MRRQITSIVHLLICIAVFCPGVLSAQTDQPTSNWIIFKQTDGLIISYKVMQFSKDEVKATSSGETDEATEKKAENVDNEKTTFIVYRFENTTSNTVSISWSNKLWYNGNCRTCIVSDNSGIYNKTITLTPGQIISGETEKDISSGLLIIQKTADRKKVLSKFEISDITITKKA